MADPVVHPVVIPVVFNFAGLLVTLIKAFAPIVGIAVGGYFAFLVVKQGLRWSHISVDVRANSAARDDGPSHFQLSNGRYLNFIHKEEGSGGHITFARDGRGRYYYYSKESRTWERDR